MSDHDRLIAALTQMGRRVEFPPTPALAEGVAARLKQGRALRRTPGRRPLVLVAASVTALALAFSAVLTFSPTARNAVADFLGIPGIRIIFGGEPKHVPGTGLSLGEATDLGAAQDLVSFEITYPGELGAPDGVYVDRTSSSDPIVNLVYKPRVGLPASQGTDVGLLLTEFEASVDEFFLKKLIETHQLDPVTIGFNEGFWLSGAHVVTFVDRTGIPFEREPRLVQGNTLIWQSGGVSYRMESELSKARSVSFARTVTP